MKAKSDAKTNLSTQETPPLTRARLHGADGYQGWTLALAATPQQGPRETFSLTEGGLCMRFNLAVILRAALAVSNVRLFWRMWFLSDEPLPDMGFLHFSMSICSLFVQKVTRSRGVIYI
jgi:hypothetical protein